MGKGGKVNCFKNCKRRVRSKGIGSDDSDEDFVVDFAKYVSDDDSENLGESVDEYGSGESFGSFVEEDEKYRKAVVRSRSRKDSRANAQSGKIRRKISRKRIRVSYEEEEEEVVVEEEKEEEDDNDNVDFVDNDEGEDDDEEFSPGDDDDDDDDDEHEEQKRRTKPKGGPKRPRSKRSKSRVAKKPSKKRGRKKRRLNKKVRPECNESDFIDDSSVSRERSRKNSGPKSRNYAVSSESEFVLSDNDYSISEEEEREASTNLRSSSSVTKIQLEESLTKKGKEKLKEAKSETKKQVCGICLSEEDKRRFRGSLDCCSHYFCFTCVMEWSKVESRCPLCKQRFETITKNGRSGSAIGVDLKNVVIQVPERDQVYQPSEEEIRSFIDPYENVICTECHEGGDDGLMLLCDLCDSPAHTFCVGLGRQVPDGNWYCNGCRPVAPAETYGETITNPVVDSSPRVAFNLGFENSPSSRFPAANIQAVSPGTGGAPTLSVRRQLHRLIQNILSNNRIFENSRTREMPSQNSFLDERLRTNDKPSSSMQSNDLLSLRDSQSGVQSVAGLERSVNLTLWPELSAMNSVSSHEPREEGQFYVVKEQLQSVVKSHLKSLSQDIELGNDAFKGIARSSTHTILAACGLEHKRGEVEVVPAPSICCHGDRVVAGQTSIMKGLCYSCFDSFVRDVVKRIMETRLPPGWLRLGL